MNLEQCASVSQGVFLSRVQTLPSSDSVTLSLFTLKEMNQWLSSEPDTTTEDPQVVHVPMDRVASLPIAREGLVLISLTGQRAIALQKVHSGKLIPSNFAIIETSESLNPDYLEWFINEHPDCKRQLKVATQGSIVSSLSIQMLRTLEMILPPLKDQLKVGSVHRLLHRKNRLIQERMVLEQQYAKHILTGYIKEEMK
ncbi:hypothetical protein [Cohnella sp. AR92]|uniref:hypothetical protein n=1 Tax=Cohnella sp. AR92 TaxID=648716 RepID=UPI000F8D6D5A|nr:hypothetical protein [Cohnella sp. AR92]RUS44563.1 hypothetical protein ELR57_22535 [Cohnella sp. AR92]